MFNKKVNAKIEKLEAQLATLKEVVTALQKATDKNAEFRGLVCRHLGVELRNHMFFVAPLTKE